MCGLDYSSLYFLCVFKLKVELILFWPVVFL